MKYMKKFLFSIALTITLSLAASAQSDSFFRWTDSDNETFRTNENNNGFSLPESHGDVTDTTAPLGSGLLILTALSVGYAIKCRKK